MREGIGMIPKIIHYCWLSGNELPDKTLRCISSWKKYLPDYEIMLWDLSRFDINRLNWTREAYENKKFAFASDYIRFYALYNYGGIYLDSDVEVLRNMDNLLKLDFFCGYEYEGLPEAAIIGSAKKQMWALNCMQWYENNNFKNMDGSFNMKVAPVIFQSGLEKVLGEKLIDKNQVEYYVNDTYCIFPYDYFSPKNSFNGNVSVTDNSYTIHHFNADWAQKNKKIKLKKNIHLLLIRMLGRKQYIILLYYIRKKTKAV